MFIYFDRNTRRMTHSCNVNNNDLPEHLIEIEVEDEFDVLFYYEIADDNVTIIKGDPMLPSSHYQ